MRIVLFGSGPLLLGAAEFVSRSGADLVVICSPRHLQEKDEGGFTFESRLKRANISFEMSEDINTDHRLDVWIGAGAVGISLGAAWIFRRQIIDRFGGNLFNMHNARLPQDRGGGGFSWRILKGERVGMCAIHRVVEKADAGPLVRTGEFAYSGSCRIPADFIRETVTHAEQFLQDFLQDVISGCMFEDVHQQEHLSTYWPRLDTQLHGAIDWTWRADEVERFICAFDDPYPGAFTFVDDQRVVLKQAFVFRNDGSFHPFQSGIIYRKSPAGLFVACNDAGIFVRSVGGENNANWIDRLRVGDRFHSPREVLGNARIKRVYYTAQGKIVREESARRNSEM